MKISEITDDNIFIYILQQICDLIFKIDLETGKFFKYNVEAENSVSLFPMGDYSEAFEKYLGEKVFKEFRNKFNAVASLESLRENYNIGRKKLVYDYKAKDEKGIKKCFRICLYFVNINEKNTVLLSFRKFKNEQEIYGDPLTGYNDFYRYKEEVKQMLHNRGNTKYSLWYCSIRRFEFLNEIYGYEIGDNLLRFWVKLIAEDAQKDETFIRISADHFIAFRHYETKEELEERFLHIAGILEKFKGLSNKKHKPELIAGIYCIEKNEDVLSVEKMIDRAAIAQKEAYEKQGSSLCLYCDKTQKKYMYESELEENMEQALAEEEFKVYFQPLVNINKGMNTVGAEALIRWERKDGEFLIPADFLGLFERNGFIVKLDMFVLEKVCCYLKENTKNKNIFVYVNISKITIFSYNFVRKCCEIKEKYHIPDGVIVLEFPEKAAVDSPNLLKEIILDIKKCGFAIAMDNFGSGKSSFDSLRYFPVNYLKLDATFSKNGINSQTDRIIMASVISMAKVLKMKPIATHVEEEKEVNFLKKMGCDLAQGYVFSKEVPAEDFDFNVKYGLKLPDVKNERYLNSIKKYQQLNMPYVLDIYNETSMLVDNVVGGIMQSSYDDEDIKVIYANKGFYNLIGYTEEEFSRECGNKLSTLLKDGAKQIVKDRKEKFKSNDIISDEFEIKRKDGKKVWIFNHIKYNHDGTFYEFLMDISPKKQLENELISERERYKLAVENSNDILFEYDIKKDILYTYENNKDFNEIYKITTCNFSRGIEKQEAIYSNDTQKALDIICRGVKKSAEIRIKLSQSDKYEWFLAKSNLIYEKGKKSRVVGIFRNIENYKGIKEENERLHSQFALSIKNLYNEMYEVDIEKNKMYLLDIHQNGVERKNINQKFYEFINSEISNTVYKEDVEIFRNHLEKIKNHKKTEYYFEIRRKSENGDYHWYSYLLRHSDLKKNIWLIFTKDINESKKEEEKIQNRLKEALETAESANNAKTDFLSRMSHDIRTPMNAIVGMASIAKLMIDDKEKVLECLDKINVSSEYLRMLINDILDMSKIEKGKLKLKEEEFDINLFIENISSVILPQANQKNINFKVEQTNFKYKTYFGDRLRLNQILMNLLSNSLKFTGSGGTIVLEIKELCQKGEFVTFEFNVSDTGVGMKKEFIDRMYQPFEQEEADAARNQAGSGLGLAIVNSLVKLMKGKIEVESQVGEGTEFCIIIPIKCGKENILDKTDLEEEKKEAIQNKSLGNKNILLVEDNEINMEIAKTLLEMNGINVETAENGLEAFEKFRISENGYYSMILMDIRMPIMDGITATKEIRNLQKEDAKTVKIIAMSANAFTEDQQKAYNAGMNGYLIKPIEPENFLKTLKKYST